MDAPFLRCMKIVRLGHTGHVVQDDRLLWTWCIKIGCYGCTPRFCCAEDSRRPKKLACCVKTDYRKGQMMRKGIGGGG